MSGRARPNGAKARGGPKFQQMRMLEPWLRTMPRGPLRVFLVLWNVEPGNGGEFFASANLIGRRAGLSREAVWKAVTWLTRHKLLVRTVRGNSRGSANHYQIPPKLPQPVYVASDGPNTTPSEGQRTTPSDGSDQ